MFLIGRVGGGVSNRYAPPTAWWAELPAPSVRRQIPTDADVVNQSALEGGEGGRDGRALGRFVKAGVPSNTGRPKPRVV